MYTLEGKLPSSDTSADRLRIMLVVTWQEEGEWYLCRQLTTRCQCVEVLQPSRSAGHCSKWTAALAGRMNPALLALRAFARRKRFDAVCSWCMPVGVCYGLLNRLFGGRGAPRHILRDFHINLMRTDWRYRVRLALLRMALPGIDMLLCTSREEAGLYAAMFGLAPGRVSFFPDVPPSQFLTAQAAGPLSDYIFACGNSDRDFDTLLAAVEGLGYDTVILSQQFTPRRPLPDGVRILSHRISMQAMQELIQQAAVVVVPLEHERVAAGQNSLLEAMALGRPVIVTDNFATREYAVQGRTALLCPPGDAARMAQLLRQVFEDRNATEAMAARARKATEEMLNRQVELFIDSVRHICVEQS
jgi:Glycosyl transferases group 1